MNFVVSSKIIINFLHISYSINFVNYRRYVLYNVLFIAGHDILFSLLILDYIQKAMNDVVFSPLYRGRS